MVGRMGKLTRVGMLAVLLACGSGAWAVDATGRAVLREESDPGDQWTTELKLELEGEVYYRSPERVKTHKLTGTANHKFAERVLAVDKLGWPTRVARHYERAAATFKVHDSTTERGLRDAVRLQVAQRVDDETVVYAPSGPLTRNELELTGEHFDVMMISGLLPANAVAVGENWDVDLGTIQALCALDGVIKGELKCILKSLKPEAAEISFTGSAHGIHRGAEVNISAIDGSLTFDRTCDRITVLTWKQSEKRNIGPVTPESKTTFTVTVRRNFGQKSKELGDAVAANVREQPPAALLLLLHKDVKGRYEFLHERAWHMLTNSEDLAVLRLLDRGELIAQLNVTPMRKDDPGKHLSRDAVARWAEDAHDFTVGEVLQSDELPHNREPNQNRAVWVYRHSVLGKSADLDLQRNHYAVAGPKGHQAMLAFTCELEQAKNLGSRDLAIVGTVAFPDE